MRFSPFAWRRAQKPPLPGKRGWVTLCHVSLPGSETGNAVVFLEPVQEEGNDGHHGKVIGADDEENLREAEVSEATTLPSPMSSMQVTR